MSKDNVIQFPDRMNGRKLSRITLINARLEELELENDFLDGDIEYLQQQLTKNIDEVHELLHEVEKITQDTLDEQLVEFKSDFGVDINFDADFDLTPEDK